MNTSRYGLWILLINKTFEQNGCDRLASTHQTATELGHCRARKLRHEEFRGVDERATERLERGSTLAAF